jgi:serine/threonine-protein kinase RsbW
MTKEKLALKFVLTPPIGPQGIRSVRKSVSYLMGQWGFTDESRDNIALALSEALNNAREHGSVKDTRIEVTCLLEGLVAKLKVEDFGEKDASDATRAFDSKDIPPPDSERGRGIFLIRSLMDDVEMKCKPGGIIIKMIKRGP